MPSRDRKVISVIDLGTNTCLLLIASLEDNTLTTLHESLESPRIGKGIYDTGRIDRDSFERALNVFNLYKSISEEYQAEGIYAFGTSALRDASNSKEFIEYIRLETGIDIKVISGSEEAMCSFIGATYDLEGEEFAVIDIGGGSTEISFRENGDLINESADIGSVRLTDKFFRTGYDTSSFEAAKSFADSILSDLTLPASYKELVGVAGTVTTLAAIKLGLKDFDADRIHGTRLTLENVETILHRLMSINDKDRLEIGSYMSGRSDIIVAGALILSLLMKKLEAEDIIVSAKGLRYGLMLRLDDFSDII